MTKRTKRIVVGITGASGALYARRVVELLALAGTEVHLAVTPLGRRLLHDELGMEGIDAEALTGGQRGQWEGQWEGQWGGRLIVHRDRDVGAVIASGSFLHDGMVIVPCSSNTLGAIASGVTLNLVHRAAMVCLKERRRLILAHREMPISHIDIENMARLSAAGAIVAPLSPGFYMLPRTVEEVVDGVAARLVDLLGVPHDLPSTWTGATPASSSRLEEDDAAEDEANG